MWPGEVAIQGTLSAVTKYSCRISKLGGIKISDFEHTSVISDSSEHYNSVINVLNVVV